MTAELIREWHPLDGVSAPEYIPPQWDGPHVGKRLAEALRTLTHLSIGGAPRGFANAWPEYAVEWIDEIAQAGADKTQQAQDAAAKNWTKIIPSAEEITRMEQAIAWPARYVGDLPQLLRAVGAVAIAKARHQNVAAAARKLRVPRRLARRWHNEGCELIAAGLARDEVLVF
jgi:hypothetical protein